ncbi:MAG: hypothetical protein HN909_09415 [Phycisphaerales bacterium]|jgi:membrane-bound serine protease (ClpP class)|nr:hypothetical protein [Phycisphaerales bacterium]MBT7171968.1 hypothetical protein [Phycisphaerales bacterium]
MDPTLIASILLLIISAALIIMEILTPSMGILSLLATGIAAAGVYFAFSVSSTAGYAMLAICVIGTPVLVILGMKYLPDSYLGRKIFLRKAPDATADACPIADELAHLVGKDAIADTELRPAGVIRVDNKRYDARSEYGLVEKGTPVTILRAAGTDVVVRPLESNPESN